VGPFTEGGPTGPLKFDAFSGAFWEGGLVERFDELSEEIFRDCGVKIRYRANRIIRIII
jgi:hypothetical protein